MTRTTSRVIRNVLILGALAVLTAVVAGIYYMNSVRPQAVQVKAKPPASAPLEPAPIPGQLNPAQPISPKEPITPLESKTPRLPGEGRRRSSGHLARQDEIPRLKVVTTVIEGTDERELRRGAGHVPSTAMPGPAGNVAIAAHRDKFFRALRFIQANDEILVETGGHSYRYIVKGTEIVTPSNVSVLHQTRDPQLTLITCYPFFFKGHAPNGLLCTRKAGRSCRPPLNTAQKTNLAAS